MKRRLIELLLWIDYKTDGIRWRLFVAAAVLQVFLAPLWDQYLPYQRVAARMEPMTFLATILFMGVSLSLVGGRLIALSLDEDSDDSARPALSLRRSAAMAVGLMSRYWRLLRMDPWPAIVSRLGAAACVTILALRGAVSLVRWSLWKLMNGLESLLPSLSIWDGPRRILEWVYFRERAALKWAVLLSIPVTILAAVAFLRKPARGQHSTALREPRALAGVDPLLDRRNPGRHELVGAAFRGDLVRRVLWDLSQWEPDDLVEDEQHCRDDVAFFLRERGYQVAMERWIEGPNERRRVDLLIEECIPIEMKYALHGKGAGERDRARSQVECYARLWGSSGPVLLFLAATTRESAERFSDPAARWNAALDGSTAPILVLTDSEAA